jgi:hypothetical protein
MENDKVIYFFTFIITKKDNKVNISFNYTNYLIFSVYLHWGKLVQP